jgi:hypothetical protein
MGGRFLMLKVKFTRMATASAIEVAFESQHQSMLDLQLNAQSV